MDRWTLNEKLTLVHGLRSVNTERDVRNLDVRSNIVRKPVANHDSINPDASVIYQLNDQINLFGKFVRLYEAPTNYELEDDLRGNNATLDATHGNVVEIGSRRQQRLTDSHSWNWDISLYYAALEDEILSQDDPMAPGTSLSINVDDTIHAGLEALVGNKLALPNGGWIESMVRLTVNEFSFDGDRLHGNGSLPAAPDHSIRGELMHYTANGFHFASSSI